MQSLLYFLLFAGLVMLMMRFGCGAHVMGHGHDHKDTGSPASETGSAGTSPNAKEQHHGSG